MRKLIGPFCAGALIFAGTYVAAAQDKSTASKESKEVQQDTKTMTGNRTTKTSSDTVTGKVETYEPGKTLTVTVPGKVVSTKSFSLDTKDWTYHVASNLKPGEWVKVSEKTDNNGHKTLTIQPSANKGSAARSSNQ
jgi:hypothetical protein